MTDYVKKILYRGHTICLYQDTDPINPVEDYDQFGTMVCWHGRYSLGHDHTYANPDEFYAALYDDMPCSKPQWYEEQGEDGATQEQWDAIKAKVRKAHVILPLYLYDHSGITMRTTAFSCSWDSGQVGEVYVTREDALKESTGTYLSKSVRANAERIMKAEVETYDHYLTNTCYGYEVFQGDHMSSDDDDLDSLDALDSCGGYLGDYDNSGVQDQAKSFIDAQHRPPKAKTAYNFTAADIDAIVAST